MAPRCRLLTALAAAALLAASAQAAERCPDIHATPLAMPHLKEAIAANREATIVALGSSSTQGWHSSDVAHSYPAILQSALNAALPRAHVAVINRGVGGQDVIEMMSRIEVDVVALKPAAVIWQLGANGAMKHIAPELFKRLLANGVKRLLDAKVDVVLMDNQRAPVILAAPEHRPIEKALVDVAVANKIGLFSRGDLMDRWRDAGYPYAEFVSEDGVHHNDLGYRCVAEALSAAIIDGLDPGSPDRALVGRR